MSQNRRDFLKNAFKVTVGAFTVAALPLGISTYAEEKEQEDFKWVPNAAPCKLIKETTTDSTPEGTRSFSFTTDGRTCSKSITFDIVGEERTLANVIYDGGCDGGTQGIACKGCDGTSKGFSILSEGMTIDYCVERMGGILCDGSKGSSCPDQCAKALAQAKVYLTGAECTGCNSAT